jgi:hypothetical protein
MPDAPRLYANQLILAVGERDAVIGADYVHPELVGDPTTAKGERVVELVIPRAILQDLRGQLDDALPV